MALCRAVPGNGANVEEEAPTLLPGDRLRNHRYRLGVTSRDKGALSQKIAEQKGQPELYISIAWLTAPF